MSCPQMINAYIVATLHSLSLFLSVLSVVNYQRSKRNILESARSLIHRLRHDTAAIKQAAVINRADSAGNI